MEWILLLNFVAACFCAWVAKEKNRDTTVWFILGCLFGVLSLLAIAGMPKAEIEAREVPSEFVTEKVPLILIGIALLVAVSTVL